MKTILMGAIVAMAAASPALAWEGQKVACYDKVWVPATYNTKKVLEYPAHTKWAHSNGQMVEMYYAPVYMEKKSLAKAGHYVLREAGCR